MKRAALLALIIFLLTVLGGAQSVSIANASFETGTLALSSGNGSYSNLIASSTVASTGGTLANWTATASTTNAAAGGYSPVSGGVNWTSAWWSGSTIAYLQITAAGTVSFSQTLAATLQNNTTYTLSAQVGRRAFTPRFNYSLQLWLSDASGSDQSPVRS